MRYLNKIVLMQSAHVPYAEIELGGNVHFIGTQGVGKSTLLRAILFFYNVNKGGLGIRTQDKQQSFDEFYLPYPNSYLIYEVARETGTFFIMVFRHGMRAAYRIVDCPYDRRFFIDEGGEVRYEWGRISEAIGSKVFKSNIIKANEQLRDIIYGNQPLVDKGLRRFSIMESTKYQNVPRTIQNIFLNQSLESEFIKKTIIDSMNFASDGIDLNFYRDKVKDFRQQYEDIWKWYRKERNGQVKVRQDAASVLERYSLYEASRKLIGTLCGQLRHAIERDQALLPQVEQQLADARQQLERQRRLLSEEQKKHSDERDKTNREMGEVEALLKTIKRKRDHYEQIGIAQIVERMGKEEMLKVEYARLRRQEEELTLRSRDVKDRYDQLIRDVEQALKTTEVEMRQQEVEADRLHYERVAQIQRQLNDRKEELRKVLSEENNSLSTRQQTINEEIADAKVAEQRAQTANPYATLLDDLQQQTMALTEEKVKLQHDSDAMQQQMDKLRAEVEIALQRLEAECKADILRLEQEETAAKREVDRLNLLQNRQQGSLIEWLGQNVKGWERTLGQVLDEETVLYNTQLSPKLETPSSATVYGVKLNTDNIDRPVLTPAALHKQLEKATAEAEDIAKRKTERLQQQDTDKEAAERKPARQLKDLRMEKMKVDGQLQTIPGRQKLLDQKRDALHKQLQQWRDQETAAARQRLDNAQKQLIALAEERAEMQQHYDKNVQALEQSIRKQTKELEQEKLQQKRAWDALLDKRRESAQRETQKLTAMMHAELKGQGVDVNQLEAISRQLRGVGDELAYIDAHRADYIGWQNDKKEHLDRETEYLEQRKMLKGKQAKLEEKYDLRRKKLELVIADSQQQVASLNKRHETMLDSFAQTEAFLKSSSRPQEWAEAKPKKTEEPLLMLLASLRDELMGRMQRQEDFKQAVNTFKRNFSPQNTFHFKTQIDTEEDYEEFAANLNEFVANEKIEEYRMRISGQYATILHRIAREMGQLGQHSADIRATINEINRDFREHNFVGAIKDIELRAVDSTDRLVVQLASIKTFTDENANNLGTQLNLFSTEADLQKTNDKAVKMLMALIDLMDADRKRDRVTLEDSFKLEFKVRENANDTSWVEKLSNVGSDGTDVLVKAMVNIMLINVFKGKISRKFGDFKLHCMMDEIGKLHPNNVEGILRFANVRNIYLINSSPTAYNASAYRHTYALHKDAQSNTIVKTLLTIK